MGVKLACAPQGCGETDKAMVPDLSGTRISTVTTEYVVGFCRTAPNFYNSIDEIAGIHLAWIFLLEYLLYQRNVIKYLYNSFVLNYFHTIVLSKMSVVSYSE
jgi:hypothetical protein